MLPLELYWSGLFRRYPSPESNPPHRLVVEALRGTRGNGKVICYSDTVYLLNETKSDFKSSLDLA